MKDNVKADIPLTTILQDLSVSAKNLVKNEMKLLEFQIEGVADDISLQVKKLAAFSCLAAISIIFLMAAVVISLGEYLDNRYWLSALTVGAVWTVITLIFGFRATRKKDVAPAVERASEQIGFAEARIETKVVNPAHALEGA